MKSSRRENTFPMKPGNRLPGVKPESRVHPSTAHYRQKGTVEGGIQSHKDGERRRFPPNRVVRKSRALPGPPPASALSPNTTQAVVSANQAGEARGSQWPTRDMEERPLGKGPEPRQQRDGDLRGGQCGGKGPSGSRAHPAQTIPPRKGQSSPTGATQGLPGTLSRL